jgi:Flp pilus assembly protein CpaB
MKSRGIAIIVAFFLAVGATLGVYLYVQGVRRTAKATTTAMVPVIVAKQNINAQTKLDDLINAGDFTTLSVPRGVVVEGAVTDIAQLRGKVTSYPILAGEQISTQRLEGTTTIDPFGLQAGMQAVSLAFPLPQAVGGQLQAGDHVTLYATFDSVKVIQGKLSDILSGKVTDAKSTDVGDFTTTLVPDVRVLKVSVPPAPNAAAQGQISDPTQGNVLLTLELSPENSQRVVLAEEEGKLWVALIRPGDQGTFVPPTNGLQVIFK